MKRYDAVVSGYLCVDLIPDFMEDNPAKTISEVLKPGKLIEIKGLNATLGGVVANTGMAMKRFSKNVFLNGVIGDDFIGKIAMEWLNNFQFDHNIKEIKGSGTAFSLVIAPPGVDRIFLESPGSNYQFDIDCIDFEAVNQSRVFHFGYPPLLKSFYQDEGTQLVDLFSRIYNMEVVTSLDFSLPDPQSESSKINWVKTLKRILPFTDVFAPSLEEALLVMMPSTYLEIQSRNNNKELIDMVSMEVIHELGQQIIEAGAKIVLIKAGHRGAYLKTGDISSLNKKDALHLSVKDWNFQEFWCPAYPVEDRRMKNASGAGDTAVAAFLAGILDGNGPQLSLQYAAVAGRDNLYYYGIDNTFPNWAEVIQKVKKEKNPVIDLKQFKNKKLFHKEIFHS